MAKLAGEKLSDPLQEFLLNGVWNRLSPLRRDLGHELVNGDVLQSALAHDLLAILLQLVAPTAFYQFHSDGDAREIGMRL